MTQWGSLVAIPSLGGAVSLRVDEGVVRGGRIEKLSASGKMLGLDLAALTEGLGVGKVEGDLRVVVEHLEIEQNEVTSARIVAEATSKPDRPATIHRSVIEYALEHLFGSEVPNLPVEELEYAHLGARIEVEPPYLWVRGLYGDGQQTILSLRLLGSEMPVIRAPADPYKLEDVIRWLREQASMEQIREIIDRRRTEHGLEPLY